MMEYHCLTRMSVKFNYLCRVGGLMHPDNLHVVADLALLNDEGFRADVEIDRVAYLKCNYGPHVPLIHMSTSYSTQY